MMMKDEQKESKNAETIKAKGLKPLAFMERETRLELATSSLARKHSTTELLSHLLSDLIIHAQFFISSTFLDSVPL